ncbi:DUF1161 domain-containing protein [Variovorax paradoxus]|nr:DUF1161 domain-containing protein [Variovorax paradoxus]
MLRFALASVALVFAHAASGAGNCDAILSQIDMKIRAAGVSRFTLTTVDANAEVAGKVVGTCDLGTKKIVYAQGELPNPPNSPPRPRSEPLLTECKDGSVPASGECKK